MHQSVEHNSHAKLACSEDGAGSHASCTAVESVLQCLAGQFSSGQTVCICSMLHIQNIGHRTVTNSSFTTLHIDRLAWRECVCLAALLSLYLKQLRRCVCCFGQLKPFLLYIVFLPTSQHLCWRMKKPCCLKPPTSSLSYHYVG